MEGNSTFTAFLSDDNKDNVPDNLYFSQPNAFMSQSILQVQNAAVQQVSGNTFNITLGKPNTICIISYFI